jgi:hypothetical protein
MEEDTEPCFFAEHTLEPLHGVPPTLYNVNDFEGLTGFTTVYQFNEEVATHIMSQWSEKHQCYGSFVGLAASQLPVATDTLIADFDQDKESAMKFIDFLKMLGVGFNVWDSGGSDKGTGWASDRYHIVVDAVWKESPNVPFSQLRWMEDWANSCGATFDKSVYRAASLIRLPGTIHHRTGNPKSHIVGYKGHKLDYDLGEKPESRAAPQDEREILQCLWRQLLREQEPGGRRFTVWKITSNAKKLGWDVDKIYEHLKYWNSRLNQPLSESELQEKLWKS